MERETVLITGSSKGLGKELATVFAEHNYNIILNARHHKELEKTRAELSNRGVNVFTVVGDITNDNTIIQLAWLANRTSLSILINNAGSELSGLKYQLHTLHFNHIEELINVHLTAAIKMTNKIYPIFLKRGGGTIININSLAGLESQPLRSTYCASKWGLRGFTETLRIEAAPDNIKVMAIYPSRIKTRPEFASYGWEPREVAHKIYIAYKDGVLDLDLDARPEEFKKKR